MAMLLADAVVRVIGWTGEIEKLAAGCSVYGHKSACICVLCAALYIRS
ncbi:MAG: hypothetical protein LBG27_09110 [Spirochaetaceae bacterium]|nr:hypothetical protein [Spirochaetaceae bacterium]